MMINGLMDSVVARCSRFSGYNLSWRVEDRPYGRVLVIEDPSKGGSSRLCVCEDGHESYGRCRHWAISRTELAIFMVALGKPSEIDRGLVRLRLQAMAAEI